jgi:signal transduction histidine kinase
VGWKVTRETLPETYFAPATLALPEELARQIQAASNNPVIDSLLAGFSGMLVVLNAERQIIAMNSSYLLDLQVDDPRTALGLRPGDVLQCVHSGEHPGGCGTSRFCETCGAAIAIVGSQASGAAEERECVLRARRGAEVLDLDMVVRACPIQVEGFMFTALFLRDISADKRRSVVERAFFHDLNNVVGALLGTSEMFESEDAGQWPELAHDIVAIAERIRKEIELQRALSSRAPGGYQLSFERVPVSEVLGALESFFAHHAVRHGKELVVASGSLDASLLTDRHLLLRILTNMLMNAFEGTPAGGSVRLVAMHNGANLTFEVWNEAPIAPAVALRVFQRYFSTKGGAHRGQGTFIMRLFGESYLGGSVTFQSDKEAGTTFTFRVPLEFRQSPTVH